MTLFKGTDLVGLWCKLIQIIKLMFREPLIQGEVHDRGDNLNKECIQLGNIFFAHIIMVSVVILFLLSAEPTLGLDLGKDISQASSVRNLTKNMNWKIQSL